MTIEIIHRVVRPFADGIIEVYGEPSMGWYEWRIVKRDAVIHDTAKHGSLGLQYGSPSIALRDALNHDEPPKAKAVVPIRWLDKADALPENITQAHRADDAVRSIATELIDAATAAKLQRCNLSADYSKGRLGMVYTNSRVEHAERMAQMLNEAADNLLDIARD